LFKSVADLTCPVAWISDIKDSGGKMLRAFHSTKRGDLTRTWRSFSFFLYFAPDIIREIKLKAIRWLRGARGCGNWKYI
jgi:hypothetical protein